MDHLVKLSPISINYEEGGSLGNITYNIQILAGTTCM